MKKYKVEITKTYCVDLLAKEDTAEETLIEQAEIRLDTAMANKTEHYLQTGDTEFTVFDVTNTDDPFHPNN